MRDVCCTSRAEQGFKTYPSGTSVGVIPNQSKLLRHIFLHNLKVPGCPICDDPDNVPHGTTPRCVMAYTALVADLSVPFAMKVVLLCAFAKHRLARGNRQMVRPGGTQQVASMVSIESTAVSLVACCSV